MTSNGMDSQKDNRKDKSCVTVFVLLFSVWGLSATANLEQQGAKSELQSDNTICCSHLNRVSTKQSSSVQFVTHRGYFRVSIVKSCGWYQ